MLRFLARYCSDGRTMLHYVAGAGAGLEVDVREETDLIVNNFAFVEVENHGSSKGEVYIQMLFGANERIVPSTLNYL
jgi:hypothetical protein